MDNLPELFRNYTYGGEVLGVVYDGQYVIDLPNVSWNLVPANAFFKGIGTYTTKSGDSVQVYCIYKLTTGTGTIDPWCCRLLFVNQNPAYRANVQIIDWQYDTTNDYYNTQFAQIATCQQPVNHFVSNGHVYAYTQWNYVTSTDTNWPWFYLGMPIPEFDWTTTFYQLHTLSMQDQWSGYWSDTVPFGYPPFKNDFAVTNGPWLYQGYAQPGNFPDAFSQCGYYDAAGTWHANYWSKYYGTWPLSWTKGPRVGLIGAGNPFTDLQLMGGGAFFQLIEGYFIVQNAWAVPLGLETNAPVVPWFTYLQVLEKLDTNNAFAWNQIFPVDCDLSVSQTLNYAFVNTYGNVASNPLDGDKPFVCWSPTPDATHGMLMATGQLGTPYSWADPKYMLATSGNTNLTKMSIIVNGTGYYANADYYEVAAGDAALYVKSNLYLADGTTQVYLPGDSTLDYFMKIDTANGVVYRVNNGPKSTLPGVIGAIPSDATITANNKMWDVFFNQSALTLTVRQSTIPLTVDVPYDLSLPVYATDIRTFL